MRKSKGPRRPGPCLMKDSVRQVPPRRKLEKPSLHRSCTICQRLELSVEGRLHPRKQPDPVSSRRSVQKLGDARCPHALGRNLNCGKHLASTSSNRLEASAVFLMGWGSLLPVFRS